MKNQVKRKNETSMNLYICSKIFQSLISLILENTAKASFRDQKLYEIVLLLIWHKRNFLTCRKLHSYQNPIYLENAIQSQVNYENFAFYSNFSCEYNFCPKTQCILQCSMRMNNCAISECLSFLNDSKCEPNVNCKAFIFRLFVIKWVVSTRLVSFI